MSQAQLALEADEEILQSRQALVKTQLRSGWRPGQLHLTNHRLLFFQPPRIAWQTVLGDVVGVRLERQAVIVRTKPVLVVTHRKPGQENGLLRGWVAVADPEVWRRRIYERSLLTLSDEDIEQVVAQLDPGSQAILVHLWHNRHATLEELSCLYSAPNHMDTLLKIRKTINPTAERVLGYSVLSFERSRVDERTGEPVTFSWWLLGKRADAGACQKPLIDIFDEGDSLSVVMEWAGVREEDILLTVEQDRLVIAAEREGVQHREEVRLPQEVRREGYTTRYNNHIFQVKLQKLKG